MRPAVRTKNKVVKQERKSWCGSNFIWERVTLASNLEYTTMMLYMYYTKSKRVL